MENEDKNLNQNKEENPLNENNQNKIIIINNELNEHEQQNQIINEDNSQKENLNFPMVPQDNKQQEQINNEIPNENKENKNNNSFLIPMNEPYYTDQNQNFTSSIDCNSSSQNIIKHLGKKKRKEYRCEQPDCNKIFYDSIALRKHILTHGEKLFVCKICSKKFLDNSKLRRHSLVHSGEKPYTCKICNKNFSLDFNLRTHMRIHSGEKPYACVFPGCFKRFSQSSNLSAHEKTHELLSKKDGNNFDEINNKPIFTENPLKYVIENSYSGTETLNNIQKINEIFEKMQKGIQAQLSSMNQMCGYQTKNHGEIPGMPFQKRTYIKKINRENGNTNFNYERINSNKKLIFQVHEGYDYNENNEKIFSNEQNNKSIKKQYFRTYRDNIESNNSEINNIINDYEGKNEEFDINKKNEEEIDEDEKEENSDNNEEYEAFRKFI